MCCFKYVYAKVGESKHTYSNSMNGNRNCSFGYMYSLGNKNGCYTINNDLSKRGCCECRVIWNTYNKSIRI